MVLKAVMDQVLKIWDMSKIPVMTTINATTKLKRLWEKWLNLQKKKNTKQPKSVSDREAFVSDLDTLFDISSET